MSCNRLNRPEWLSGTIVRLNVAAGFGYVREVTGQGTYIFLVGLALRHSEVRLLAVGRPVRFALSGNGRIDALGAD